MTSSEQMLLDGDSCHKLHIETGRYKTPPIPRENRTCLICSMLEDEHHALFVCPAHLFIRQKNSTLLREYHTVGEITNPKVYNDITKIANYLIEIEENMVSLHMVQ